MLQLDLLQKPFINIAEYDSSNHCETTFSRVLRKKYSSYVTGLGYSNTGIFITDPKELPKYDLSQLSNLDPNNYACEQLLGIKHSSNYRQNHTLFFGYFNKDN